MRAAVLVAVALAFLCFEPTFGAVSMANTVTVEADNNTTVSVTSDEEGTSTSLSLKLPDYTTSMLNPDVLWEALREGLNLHFVPTMAIHIAIIVLGVLLCFFGSKNFKVIVAFVCFLLSYSIFSAVLARTPIVSSEPTAKVAIALIGALLVTSLVIGAMFFTMMAIYIGVGAFLAYFGYEAGLHKLQDKHEVFYPTMAALVLLGALIGYKATRLILSLLTSVLGAIWVAVGTDALIPPSYSSLADISSLNVKAFTPRTWGIAVGCVLLAVLGTVFQLGVLNKSKRRSSSSSSDDSSDDGSEGSSEGRSKSKSKSKSRSKSKSKSRTSKSSHSKASSMSRQHSA